MHLINIFWSNVYPILNTNNFPDIRNIVNQKQNVLDDKKKCAPPPPTCTCNIKNINGVFNVSRYLSCLCFHRNILFHLFIR